MTSPNSNQPVVRPASIGAAAEALDLTFSDMEPEDRAERVELLVREAQAGQLSLAGLLEARREEELVGATFLQIQTGRTALVWPPRLVPGEGNDTALQLITAGNDWLTRQPVSVAYALLEVVTQQDDITLAGGGFEPLTELLYMVCGSQSLCSSPPPSDLEYEPYTEANHERLSRLVESTYRDTLDCPRLDGVRRIEDVLAGYRASGAFDPERWLFVRHQGRDVGCLLLTDYPEQGNWELIYMGVVAEARGHGWGMQIARHAQWLTHRARRERLVLAVDMANTPAIVAYTEVGFQAWQQRSVYLKVIDPCP